jgi:hypothetical protein
MSNFLYGNFKQSLLSQNPSVDLDTDTIKVALVSNAYTPNTNAGTSGDQYYSSLSGVIATATVTSKTVTGGVFDAADVTFTSVTSTATVQRLVLYKEIATAANSTWPLIAVIGSATSGLPVTPNGGDITVSWDNGSSKIFAL